MLVGMVFASNFIEECYHRALRSFNYECSAGQDAAVCVDLHAETLRLLSLCTLASCRSLAENQLSTLQKECLKDADSLQTLYAFVCTAQCKAISRVGDADMTHTDLKYFPYPHCLWMLSHS